MRRLVLDLASALRELVAPRLGAHGGRAHARAGAGGDVTFGIDAEAEAFLAEWVASHAPEVAFYSEDRGLVTPAGGASPEHVLVVDPIDGTRPALAGFEAACTSVAVAPLRDGAPTMGDVSAGCVVEIKSGEWFLAERGRGCEASVPLARSTDRRPRPDVLGLRLPRPPGAPAGRGARRPDRRAPRSAAAASTSARRAYDMTRVVTGQLDAYIEPSPRLVEEVPGMRAAFERVGGGAVLNNSPYDLAAAVLCVRRGRRHRDRRRREVPGRPPAARVGPRAPDVRARRRVPPPSTPSCSKKWSVVWPGQGSWLTSGRPRPRPHCPD